MLRFLLIITISCYTLIIQGQSKAIEFLEARNAQIKTITTGTYHITTKMKFLFDVDTSEFHGRCFFEHQNLKDTTFYKVHTYKHHLNLSQLYLGQTNQYYHVDHDRKIVEGWFNTSLNRLMADRSVFNPLVFRDYMKSKISESDSIWLEVDTLLDADVLCFFDQASPSVSEVRVENDLTKIYFNKHGLPFRMTTYLELADYGVYEYKDQEIHFLTTNIPPLSNMHEIYGERGYTYVDGIEADQEHEANRDSTQIKLGTTSPNWQAQTYAGENLDLSQIEGKLILLDFWYKGCFPCIQSMPLLNQLHQKYADKGLTIIGINPYQSKAEEILPFLKKKSIEHPNLYSASIPSLYGVFAYPTYIFLDENKKVVKVQRGYGKRETDADFEAWIDAYLSVNNIDK
ncbi:TlpA disulfide reductase family protein [Aureispira sp. CCB-E]|uniref:TlpA family protein disulfide reductase n=1 Tax=Aureispira sp. CCB-E TaxID=3051121 RepID=UPI00286929C8|nr:TlpA disulfide reductase family protein [Aureispira sp. CCB-E]WMX15898.1 TlpA disulfide reductase family protein [Aureispira sp. CCB-E]